MTIDIDTSCPAGGEHDIHPTEVVPAEGAAALGRDIDGACVKCGAGGFPVYIAPTFCSRCGGEIDRFGYGDCESRCEE